MTVVQSVQSLPAWQVPRSRELAPAIRETLDVVDSNAAAILRARDDVASAHASVPKGIITVVGGVVAGVGGVSLLSLVGGMAGAAPMAITAGVFVIAGAVIACSARSEIRQAEAALEEKLNKAEELARQLEERCEQERAANEQSLRKTGRDGLSLVRHVESDPYVAVSADRHAHASRVVTRDREVLEMTRRDRFAVSLPRSQEIWSEKADIQGLFGLLGMVGTLWTSFAIGATVGSPAVMLGGLAVIGCEWLGLKRFGAKLVEPRVDRQLKHEIQAEIASYEPRLDALREARDTARQMALEHYAKLLEGTAAPAPGKVEVGEQQVVIGGVTVPRSVE